MSARTPTPLPAPPVKIQRGNAAPPRTQRPVRRKKKVNPFVRFLRGVARRIYIGIKIS